MTINFIRHGKTLGNLEKRYIGHTDEPLCEEGITELKNITYPDCDIVVSSTMKRCISTAKLIYPSKHILTYEELRECDFGDYEGKNHTDLCEDTEYQKWLKSGIISAFPNGENIALFRSRCVTGFFKAVEDNKSFNILSFVVHGGTIMSILEKLAFPHKDYYDYMIENGHGFITRFDNNKIDIINKI